MQLQPCVFWRMTLAEWRAALGGHADRLKMERRGQAWTVSHLLVAAGCEPDKVTPAKLMGEKQKRRKVAPEVEQPKVDELFARLQAQAVARAARVGEVGEETVAAEEAAALAAARAEARRRFEREG